MNNQTDSIRLQTENEALMVWGKRIYSYYLNHMQDWELALLLEEAPDCICADFIPRMAADLGISVDEFVEYSTVSVKGNA